jgi:hypothetical protein
MASYSSLPYGWMMEFDVSTNHPYWVRMYVQYMSSLSNPHVAQVDTQAKPPRSTWVHPYQDEQYLSEHPEIREQLMGNAQHPSNITCSQPPPPYNYSAPPNQDVYRDTNASCPQKLDKKSFYGKLKARVTGKTGPPEAEERSWKEESSQNLQAQVCFQRLHV